MLVLHTQPYGSVYEYNYHPLIHTSTPYCEQSYRGNSHTCIATCWFSARETWRCETHIRQLHDASTGVYSSR